MLLKGNILMKYLLYYYVVIVNASMFYIETFFVDPAKTETLIVAIEDNGEDYSSISDTTNVPIEVCKIAVQGLHQQVQRSDNDHKKRVMGTGNCLKQ